MWEYHHSGFTMQIQRSLWKLPRCSWWNYDKPCWWFSKHLVAPSTTSGVFMLRIKSPKWMNSRQLGYKYTAVSRSWVWLDWKDNRMRIAMDVIKNLNIPWLYYTYRACPPQWLWWAWHTSRLVQSSCSFSCHGDSWGGRQFVSFSSTYLYQFMNES